jgi:hypothetical protein
MSDEGLFIKLYNGYTIIRGIFLVREQPGSTNSVGYTGTTGSRPAMSYKKYDRDLPKFLRKKRAR